MIIAIQWRTRGGGSRARLENNTEYARVLKVTKKKKYKKIPGDTGGRIPTDSYSPRK